VAAKRRYSCLLDFSAGGIGFRWPERRVGQYVGPLVVLYSGPIFGDHAGNAGSVFNFQKIRTFDAITVKAGTHVDAYFLAAYALL